MSRVSLYISVPVCLLAVGLTYWLGSKDYDFVTPPEGMVAVTEDEMSALKVGNEPPMEELAVVEPAAEPTELEPVKAIVVELPESNIDDYLDQVESGAEGFEALAKKLIKENHSQHSLVAWERVLDSSRPTLAQVKEAYGILKLHKPVERPEGKIAISVTLHASVPGDLVEKMTKILNVSAAVIEEGSAFAIDVTPQVSVVAVRKGKPRPSVSIWLSGNNETSRGHFRTRSANELGLSEKVNNTIFNIVGPYLEEHTELTPLEKRHPEINAQETLGYLITRHTWREFGRLLYTELEKTEGE